MSIDKQKRKVLMAKEPLDPNCPEVRYNAGHAEETGRENARLVGTVKRWILYAGFAVTLVLFLPTLSGMIVSYYWEGSRTDRVLTAATPCFISAEKECGIWAHPGQWFGGDADLAVAETSPPVSVVSTAHAEPANAEVPAEENLCPDGSANNIWILGDCAWRAWSNDDSEPAADE